MSAPQVTIVVVNWRRADDTIECLDSLAALEYTGFDVVLVDNASGDDSVARIRAAYPGVRVVVSEANRGFAGGNNLGVQEALDGTSDFVWLLNNDARVAPSTLAELVGVAERDPRIGAVGSVAYYASDPERVEVWGGGYVSVWSGRTRVQTRQPAAGGLDYVSGVSLLLRTSALRDVGLLDENYFMYWEDADLGFRLRAKGWRLAVAARAAIWHKGTQSTGGFGNPKAYEMYCRSARRFFRTHSLVPVLPMALRLVGGLVKWSLKRDWRRATILLRSVLDA